MRNELIIIGVNFIITAVISWTTAKIAFRSDIKKYLHSKREKIYFELYSELDKILQDRSMIYNEEITNKIINIKPALKLIASKDIILSYIKIHDMIKTFQKDLEDFKSENDPEREIEYDDDGIQYQPPNLEFELEHYFFKLEQYKRDNLPNQNDIQNIVNEITNNMRNDLGSRKIKWGENGRIKSKTNNR